MDVFEPLRDFFQRRQRHTLNNQAARITLVNQRHTSTLGNFVFPGSDFLDSIEVAGLRVGYVDYGINPLQDRLYINMIDIEPAHQRQGISQGVLWQLWLTHQVPIVPLHQYASSDGFWSRARQRFAGAGALIEGELRGFDQLQQAKQRWQHLVPEPEHERLIREYWAWVEAEHAAGRPAGPGIR